MCNVSWISKLLFFDTTYLLGFEVGFGNHGSLPFHVELYLYVGALAHFMRQVEDFQRHYYAAEIIPKSCNSVKTPEEHSSEIVL